MIISFDFRIELPKRISGREYTSIISLPINNQIFIPFTCVCCKGFHDCSFRFDVKPFGKGHKIRKIFRFHCDSPFFCWYQHYIFNIIFSSNIKDSFRVTSYRIAIGLFIGMLGNRVLYIDKGDIRIVSFNPAQSHNSFGIFIDNTQVYFRLEKNTACFFRNHITQGVFAYINR